MAPSKTAVTLAQSDFPLYTIKSLGDRHFLVAGGGGQSKTGISNTLEVYEIKSTDGVCTAKRVLRYDTETKAIMGTAVAADGPNFLVAAGMEGLCQLYMLRYKLVTSKDESQVTDNGVNIRKRKGKHTQSQDYKSATKTVSFEVDSLESVQTDFDKDYPFQKVVQISSDHKFLATGGADGHLRIWKYPSLKKLSEIKAHKNEIDDLDINPVSNKIVTVSRDNHAYVWSAKDTTKITELVWDKKTQTTYRIRSCRYGIVIDKKDKHVLFTVHIPSKRERKPQPCYICKWDTTSHRSKVIVNAGKEELSACAISEDGIYLGTGSISGDVSVYISFSLQRMYHVASAHSIFVTGLEFVSSSETTRAITGDRDFSLFSISVDNTIKLHQVDKRGTISSLWAIIGFAVLIYLIFWLLTAFGL